MRVSIMGSSGAGKTHLASKLAREMALPHLELDSLRHQANWKPLDDNRFKKAVQLFCSTSRWVIDGNYRVVQHLVVQRATDIILLDYSRRLVMRRLIARSLGRVLFRKELWNGNREQLRYLFSSNPEENVLLWSWINYELRRAEFDDLPGSVTNADGVELRIHRVKHPRQINALVRELKTYAADE